MDSQHWYFKIYFASFPKVNPALGKINPNFYQSFPMRGKCCPKHFPIMGKIPNTFPVWELQKVSCAFQNSVTVCVRHLWTQSCDSGVRTLSIIPIHLLHFTCGHTWGGGGGVFPGIFRGAVPPGSLNPNPISALKMLFSTPVFRLGVLNPYPFSDLV